MKTKILIIIAIFCLSIIFLFSNANIVSTDKEAEVSLNLRLAPMTPAEADFYESVPESMIDIAKLAPITPKEADFCDARESQTAVNDTLAPKTPSVADFEEI